MERNAGLLVLRSWLFVDITVPVVYRRWLSLLYESEVLI